MLISAEQRRAAFAVWLRTGRLVSPVDSRGHEVKFNPWHDVRTGRFTFAGQGRYDARGGTRAGKQRRALRQDAPTILLREDLPPLASPQEAAAVYERLLGEHGQNAANRELIEAWYRRQQFVQTRTRTRTQAQAQARATRNDPGHSVAEFAAGAGIGAYHVARSSVEGLYTLATTNPATTLRDVGVGIARAVDGAIHAEETPTYVHLDRAADAAAHASARDWGYAVGSIGSSVAATFGAPALVSRISAATRAGKAESAVSLTREVANPWLLAPTLRGEAVEKALGHNVARNFPVVDRIINREFTSIKSIDLNAATHLSAVRLRSTLMGYVDALSEYSGTRPKGWGGLRVTEDQIGSRIVEVAIPKAANQAQQKVFDQVVGYAASLPRPVQVRIIIVPEITR